ncbi:MAG: MerC family mercury resistance protein [Planctomycetes bacterium]|nr:MerC family mercury resistance protein [Planctomycetota bacterium]
MSSTTDELTLQVSGMRCGSCVERIRSALLPKIGQGNLSVDLATSTVAVAARGVTRDGLAEVLMEMGYEVRPVRPCTPGGESEPPPGRSWARALLATPAAGLALLPSATCPLCVAAYAGALSSLGVGFMLQEQVLLPLIALFLGLTVASVAWSTRKHGRMAPLVLVLLGAACVVGGRLLASLPLLVYFGAALLVVGSFWNVLVKSGRARTGRFTTRQPVAG